MQIARIKIIIKNSVRETVNNAKFVPYSVKNAEHAESRTATRFEAGAVPYVPYVPYVSSKVPRITHGDIHPLVSQ